MADLDEATQGVLADAIHHIRERALRQAMALCGRLQPTEVEYPTVYEAAYAHGHLDARSRLYKEIERMILREAPKEVVAPEQDGGPWR